MICKTENDGYIHIYLGEDETEETVIRALVKASFNLGCPVLSIYPNIKDNQSCCPGLTDNDADSYIFLGEHSLQDCSLVVNMDVVDGHICKMTLFKVSDRHFKLDKFFFEKHRGRFDHVVRLAELMLATGTDFPDFPDADFSLRGEDLNVQADYYGFSRKEDETDWEFRKRIFVEMSLVSNDTRGVQFLYGTTDRVRLHHMLIAVFATDSDILTKMRATMFSACILDAIMEQSREKILSALSLLPGDPIELARNFVHKGVSNKPEDENFLDEETLDDLEEPTDGNREILPKDNRE
jgi:hypothetical protein